MKTNYETNKSFRNISKRLHFEFLHRDIWTNSLLTSWRNLDSVKTMTKDVILFMCDTSKTFTLINIII